MNNFYKNYIKENADLINNNKWDEFFFAEEDLQLDDLEELVNILDACDIEWRPYMTKLIYGYIPFDEEEYVIPDNIKEIDVDAIPDSIKFITIPTSVIKINESAFEGAEIDELSYLGTKAQWNKIDKSAYWDEGASIRSKHAIDGPIK